MHELLAYSEYFWKFFWRIFSLIPLQRNQNQALAIQPTKKKKASLQRFGAERERILLFTRGGRVIQARGFSVADKKTSQKREI